MYDKFVNVEYRQMSVEEAGYQKNQQLVYNKIVVINLKNCWCWTELRSSEIIFMDLLPIKRSIFIAESLLEIKKLREMKVNEIVGEVGKELLEMNIKWACWGTEDSLK